MVVTDIYHWDETNNLIYFRATKPGAPGILIFTFFRFETMHTQKLFLIGERHLYTVTDFESGEPGVVECISCSVINSRYKEKYKGC